MKLFVFLAVEYNNSAGIHSQVNIRGWTGRNVECLYFSFNEWIGIFFTCSVQQRLQMMIQGQGWWNVTEQEGLILGLENALRFLLFHLTWANKMLIPLSCICNTSILCLAKSQCIAGVFSKIEGMCFGQLMDVNKSKSLLWHFPKSQLENVWTKFNWPSLSCVFSDVFTCTL